MLAPLPAKRPAAEVVPMIPRPTADVVLNYNSCLKLRYATFLVNRVIGKIKRSEQEKHSVFSYLAYGQVVKAGAFMAKKNT